MKVNVAIMDDGHIVPRMAGWLHERLGWQLSENIDPSADINLYMPYLQWLRAPNSGTRTAAWFTHFERGTRAKEILWRMASEVITTPLVTADMYLGMFNGNARKIRMGVNRDMFDIIPGIDRVGLGVAAVGQPRKGPQLLSALIDSDYTVNYAGDWLDAGTWIPWDEMPQYYNGIETYVCTSLIEGGPAPVLEALSCGCKAVLPIGVGMMDELPEMPGVRHYTAGNIADMMRAVDEATADEHDPQALRALTEPYSIDAFCESVKAAISG